MPPVLEAPKTFINHCDTPPWIIASEEFNESPHSLKLSGVYEGNRHFFKKLGSIDNPMRRGQVFHDYLDVTFALHQWSNYQGRTRTSLRNSYVRYLRGWGLDSNGCEGAVLKSWVQSRFGIAPTFHRKVLKNDGGEEDMDYALDRMKGNQKTNAIFSQLDLLYEFCQYELCRRWPELTHRTLYRGTNDPAEHPFVSRASTRCSCVRLNNLVSFTSDPEKAWEFGSTVWKSQVPFCKIVFFSGLLPDSLLWGEDEYLIIGGNYRVQELLF